jgi:hypothetical protein
LANLPRDTFKTFPIDHHHDIRETFADHVGPALFDGGTLRLEFMVGRMNQADAQAQPTGARHVVARLAMTTGCAIDLINQMQQITEQLVRRGVIKVDGGKAEPQKIG